ncbi:hypothetical protein HHK36_026282 [Tetracentron sinense]|uniref:SWIM-type domain-containing protein n=1 Tax=Tetracentron sinense TaxID=13715 RepID=A0A834YES7_TETSI|nr:hypothetical protein HHK36_026282 [Tetracentron sinense]
MSKGNFILICQSGGKFTPNADGSLSYYGGDAHATSVNNETRFDELKSEIADMWNYDSDSITIKYFLPNNKQTLITISSDKDIQHMLDFHENSATVDVYVMAGENVASNISNTPTGMGHELTITQSDISNMPCSRSSRTTITEPVTPVDDLAVGAADAENVGQQKITRLWGNSITGLHQQFNSVNDFRDALRKYSIAHGFAYKYKRNNNKRHVSVKCKAEGCPWAVTASKFSTTQLFRITRISGTHTCGAGTGIGNCSQPKLVASIVKEKLRDNPNYTPKEIINEIRRDFGIELSYSHAYRGMEAAREELHGLYKEAYNRLPWLCEKMVETNPGSVATLITRDDLSFHRLFVAFHGSLFGFQNGCRPLLFLDTVTLKSRYQGELLAATAVDGNDGIFPVAFAIVDIANDDNWHWFLVQLKFVLSTSQSITFVADRQRGLSELVSNIFRNSYYGYCIHSLKESLKKDLRALLTQEVRVIATLFDAAYAPTREGFRKCTENIKNISPEAYEWILQSEPERWANAFFKGMPYNHITPSNARPFYSWVSELPELPIIQMIDTMRRKMMDLIYTRQVDSEQWTTRLTPSLEEKLQKEASKARSLEVLFSPGSTYEVRDDLGAVNVVNVDHWDCSCREWQITGLPCLHAVAVLGHIGRNIYDYCSKSFMSETYQLTYSKSINPVPTTDMPVHRESSPVQAMAGKKVIAICQSGGEFVTNKDGLFSYNGGEAHAIDIDHQTRLNEFKLEIAEMFNYGVGTMSIKYFLPGNKKTLITISNDKDLKRMINFHGDSVTADVYIITEENVVRDISNMPGSRSSRTTLSEAVVLANVPIDATFDTTHADAPIDATFDTTHADAPIDIPIETPLAILRSDSNDGKHHKAAQQWGNTITGVNQRFSSVHEFREALCKYSIAHGFAYKYKKNDSHRVTVKCKSEGCPWRIHASRLSTTQLICIKKMNATHTCEGAVVRSGYQATRSWVSSFIKEKLKVSPNYKPKDIADDIKRDYGIELNYSQAWRAKEIAREQLQGSYKEAYNQLPLFCEKIRETNPGSFASFITKDDSSFHRLFVSFHASLCGFQQGCRPLLFLDSTPLNSKYQGMILAATSVDGDDGVFPVAFAVVDAETDDNWRWFLLELKSAVSMSQPITFVADRQKGLKESIAEIFENAYHGYCLRYLAEKLNRDLKGQFSHEVKRLMIADLYAAAYAPRLEGFQRCAESIKSISLEAYNWVIQSEPEHWANAFFGGARYNHMVSNIGEMFYSWVSEAHELPITQMVDVIRGKMMELIYKRRMDSIQWLTRLTPSMEEKLQKETSKARSLEVLFSPGSTFEVRGDSIDVVDIDNWDCSCKGWQLAGLPCCHAIAVLECVGRISYDHCSRYYTTELYRLTYSESIHPVPNVDRPVQKESSEVVVTVTPPPTRRPPGRPKLKRTESQDVVKRQLQCSRCKGLGHNKTTCK